MALGHMAGRLLATMSGGEAQRLVLARALAQEAPIVLLDEPTSALDLGRRVDALELIDELRRERSLTVLSAIHDLTLAGQFADRLVLLRHGRVAAVGQPAAVLRDDLLSETFGAGVGVIRTAGGELAVISHRQRRAPDHGPGTGSRPQASDLRRAGANPDGLVEPPGPAVTADRIAGRASRPAGAARTPSPTRSPFQAPTSGPR